MGKPNFTKRFLSSLGIVFDIRDLASFIRRVIGVGGSAGMITGILNWIGENVPTLSLWLVGGGAFLLILAVWPNILRLIRRWFAKTNDIETTKPTGLNIQFYEQRQSLAEFRDKIGSARTIWAAYLIGGSTYNYEILKSRKFRRLLLLDPDNNKAIKAIQELESERGFKDLQDNIRKLTEYAENKNCEVKWCRDLTYSLMTIGNPPEDEHMTPTDDMWVLVEAYTPGIEADKRPSFLVERSENQELSDNLLRSFKKLWEHSSPPNDPQALDRGGSQT